LFAPFPEDRWIAPDPLTVAIHVERSTRLSDDDEVGLVHRPVEPVLVSDDLHRYDGTLLWRASDGQRRDHHHHPHHHDTRHPHDASYFLVEAGGWASTTPASHAPPAGM